MYLPGLPEIARDLGASEGAAQFTLSAFLIGMAVGQAVYGPVTDKYGRKPPLMFGVSLYVFASVACALAPTVGMLAAARFVQALGAGAGAVVTTAVVRDLWSGRDAADRFSLLMLVMGVAPILAPSLGGALLVRFEWPSVFWTLAALGLVCLAAVSVLPETAPLESRRDVRLRDAASTYVALLRNRPFMTYALAGAFASCALFAYISGSSFVFIESLGVPRGTYALLFGVNALALIAASQVNRWLIRRWGLDLVAGRATLTALVCSVGLVGVTLSGHAGVWTFSPLLAALLATVGLTTPNTTALALETIRSRVGSASALRGTLQFGLSGVAGGAVGVFANGTPLPMTLVITVCVLLSVTCLRLASRFGDSGRARRA